MRISERSCFPTGKSVGCISLIFICGASRIVRARQQAMRQPREAEKVAPPNKRMVRHVGVRRYDQSLSSAPAEAATWCCALPRRPHSLCVSIPTLLRNSLNDSWFHSSLYYQRRYSITSRLSITAVLSCRRFRYCSKLARRMCDLVCRVSVMCETCR